MVVLLPTVDPAGAAWLSVDSGATFTNIRSRLLPSFVDPVTQEAPSSYMGTHGAGLSADGSEMFILDFSQWGYYSGNGGNTFQLQKIGGIQKPGYYWALYYDASGGAGTLPIQRDLIFWDGTKAISAPF